MQFLEGGLFTRLKIFTKIIQNLYKQKTTNILIMGTALIRLKIMPDSPSVNLDEIENKAKKGDWYQHQTQN